MSPASKFCLNPTRAPRDLLSRLLRRSFSSRFLDQLSPKWLPAASKVSPRGQKLDPGSLKAWGPPSTRGSRLPP